MSDHLQLRYALHERMPNGYQWTWRAEELRDSLLDDFLYRIQMPDDANTIRPEHLRGGMLKFAQAHGSEVEEHVVFYRFYDGGSDGGRSRVTMLTAWTKTDQFPTPPAANAVLGLFGNKTFEFVSNRARTIDIEKPWSLNEIERLCSTADAPSAALAEFLRGLTDKDHDYSLTILNDNQVVQKTPSAAFKYREAEAAKRKQEDQQRKAGQEKREAEEAKLRAEEMKREVELAARAAENQKQERDRLAKEKRSKKQKVTMSRILKLIVKIIGSVIVIVVVFLIGMWIRSWNSQKLSPAGLDVVDRFKKLPLDEKGRVFDELQKNVNESPVVPSIPKGFTEKEWEAIVDKVKQLGVAKDADSAAKLVTDIESLIPQTSSRAKKEGSSKATNKQLEQPKSTSKAVPD